MTCADCGGRLEEGSVADYGRSTTRSSEWTGGPLVTTTWTGAVKNGRRLAITAYRCERCGLLRLYANREATASRWS
jgi:hypothetical protein